MAEFHNHNDIITLEVKNGKIIWPPFLLHLGTLAVETCVQVYIPKEIEVRRLLERIKNAIHIGRESRKVHYSVEQYTETTLRITRKKGKELVALHEVPFLGDGRLVAVVQEKKLIHELLLNKLPDFDPDWAPLTRDAWFSAYEELVRLILPNKTTIIR